jgi:signal transduction histidine kinase
MTRARPSASALVVLVCLLALTTGAALFTARQVDEREDQLVDERANAVAGAIDRRIDTYTEKLFGVRGQFAASPRQPTRRQFETAMSGQAIARRFPGLTAIGFADVVTAARYDRYLREVRADVRRSGLGYPLLTIRPGGRRPQSVVVDYVHPLRGNESAFGVDLLAEATRRAAVSRARDTAQPSATAPIRLVQDNAPGVLIVLPLYRGADQSPPTEARFSRLRGVAYVAIRLGDLLRGIVEFPKDADLEIYDVGAVGSVTARLRAGDQAFNLRGGPDAISRDPETTRLLPLQTSGRLWTVYYAAGEEVLGGLERSAPWLIALLGLVVSLLAAGTVHFATTAQRRAVALAERMTEDLRSSRNELQRSNEELERFAFLASHDLQQPLRTVSGFLQLLDQQFRGDLPDRAAQYVDQALRGSRHMSSLIEDLLEYSRAGRSDRPLVPVDLDRAWDSAVVQLGASIEDADARVERADLPVVSGDPAQMEQVFANLIGNAVKYRGEAAPQVRASARRVHGDWEVAVEDNGIGIDPRDHERIFGMFRRLHSQDEYEGTGLGLALVKRIVERAGGQIRVESEPGSGSRFVLRLPDAGGRS